MKKLDVIGMMAENKPFDTQSGAEAPQPTSLLRPEAGSDEWGSSSHEGPPPGLYFCHSYINHFTNHDLMPEQ